MNHLPPAWLPETVGARTIPQAVDRAAAWRGDHLAVVDEDRQVSYRELAAEMRRAAAALVRAGLKPGDRAAVWAHNSLDWVLACLGVQAAGGVTVPLNTRFKGGEAQYAVNKSGAKFLIHASRFLGVEYGAMLDSLDTPTLERKISVPTAEAPDAEWESFLAWGAADPASVAEVERRLAALGPDDIADIMFTSGTTGAPKGVVANHGQNVKVGLAWIGATTLCDEDRFLLIWPFFHCAGYKAGWLASILAGSTLYPEPTLEVDRLIARVVREKITVLPGPPTLFQALLASPEGRSGVFRDLLRLTVTGATMVAPALIEAMRDDLGLQKVFTGYGLTESCGTVTMTAADDPPEIVVSSPGKAVPDVEMRCMDEAGRLLPIGEEGEIVVRGYNVMQGYYQDPAATAEVIDADGWLHTGDLGTVDAKGYLRITGRKKDIFIIGGFNCYPAEIEQIVQGHPSVAEVAVVGMPDERMGEVGKAFVVRDPAGPPIDHAGLIAWCRENMANYKVPREVVFVDALPRTATGKLQKFRLTDGEFG
ncbi:AMP-binding protein [Phenylobacterium sp.]|uniref:AMP-binding protein n=1 Tax=Phenylobacterium sp. TaxID=1871053 RepID=UPI002F41D9BC